MTVLFDQQVLTSGEWVTHAGILFLSAILFASARPLLNRIRCEGAIERRVKILRSVIVLFVVLQAIDIVLFHGLSDYENALFHLAKSIFVIYFSTILFDLVSTWSIRRFGKYKEVDGNSTYIVTYSSRMVDVLTIILLSFIVLYILVRIWELDSLLHTTGIFGVFFAFLALTNAIWAPDIYYGLTILNCNQLEDGDTITIDDTDTLYIIHRVTFIYTVLINVQKNHRTLVRNSRLIQGQLENLTKRASMDGLRFSIDYKVGYPALVDIPKSERQAAVDAFYKSINDMFNAAEAEFKSLKNPHLRTDLGFEWRFNSANDYALVYRLSYYLRPLPITQFARKVRAHINKPQGQVNELVFRHAVMKGIHLDTPKLIKSI